MFDEDRPPHSRGEARARRVRPPEGFHDPDQLSHWSVPMTVAWIIWGDLDAVREQWDDYRANCADWTFVRDADAVRDEQELLKQQFAAGVIIPTPPDLALRLKKGEWRLSWWAPANWNELFEQGPDVYPMDAINELWRFAGEGKLVATGFERRGQDYPGGLVELLPHLWPHLRRTLDQQGKATLSYGSATFHDVQFTRSDVKRMWPAWNSAERFADKQQEVAPTSEGPSDANRGGRPAEYDWDSMRDFALALIARHGKPGKDNKALPSKAQLVEALLDEWASKALHPSSSNVRRYVNRWLNEL